MSERVVHFVLPAYDEADSIGALLDRIEEVCEQNRLAYDVLVVDDGSSDGTGELASARAGTMPVRVIRNEPNQGLGVTIARGLKEATLAAAPDDVVVTLDADLTHDPAYVPAMLDALDRGADVVIASRYQQGAGVRGVSALRRLLSWGASAIVSLVRPIPGVRDYSCGFRAYRAAVLAWAFERYGDRFVRERGFGCMVELAERLRGHARFAEVPFVLHYEEKRSASTIRIWPTIAAYGRVLARMMTERGDRS